MKRQRFALRWYLCKCRKARVGVLHTEIVSRIRCAAGRCSFCGQSMADFQFDRAAPPSARVRGSLAWMQAKAALR